LKRDESARADAGVDAKTTTVVTEICCGRAFREEAPSHVKSGDFNDDCGNPAWLAADVGKSFPAGATTICGVCHLAPFRRRFGPRPIQHQPFE
jgi:hypothetical protein